MKCPDCERQMLKGATNCRGCGWRQSLLERVAEAKRVEDEQRERKRRELQQDPQYQAKLQRQAKVDYQELEATRKRLGMESRPPAPASAWGHDEKEEERTPVTNEGHRIRMQKLQAKQAERQRSSLKRKEKRTARAISLVS